MSLFSMALELALNHQGLPMTTPVRQPCQVESREWLAVLGSPALRKRRTGSNRGGIEWAVPFRGPVLPLRGEARRGEAEGRCARLPLTQTPRQRELLSSRLRCAAPGWRLIFMDVVLHIHGWVGQQRPVSRLADIDRFCRSRLAPLCPETSASVVMLLSS